MFLNQVFNLAVDDIKQIRPTFSYISNNASHYVEQLLDFVPMVDSREAHDRYHIPNRFPMRNEDLGWVLTPSTSFQTISTIDVTIPDDAIGLIFGLNNTTNNSIQLVPTILKSGKYSKIITTIHNNSGATYIEQGAVIGQLMLIKSEKLDDVPLPIKKSVKIETVQTIQEPIVETVPVTSEIIETIQTVETVEPIVEESPIIETTVEPTVETIVETVTEEIPDAQNTRPKRR
jgi:hypothetical protein